MISILRIYYFILSWNFNNRISWFFRTNWLTFSCRNLTSIRIHSVSGCDTIFTVLTFNCSCLSTFFFRIIFFVNYWRWYYPLLNRWFFPCSVSSHCCRSYLTGLWINFISCSVDNFTTLVILITFNLSFSPNLNYCFTSWGDHCIKMLCDMTVVWIYIVSACSNCFTFFTLRTLIWCTKVTSVIFFINHCGVNWCFYYFILSRDFNDCFCWIYYDWISFIWNNFPIVWIYCVSRGCCLTSVFSWDSNIVLTFFSTSIFFVFDWRWDCFYFYFILRSIFFKCFFCCMLYYVSIIWIYCIWSCCLNNVISIFRSYYFIFRCYFNDGSCWIYYYWLSYMCNSFSTVGIYCVGRCGCFTSIFSWDSNIILTFFAASIFFVFDWGGNCFYFYFIL